MRRRESTGAADVADSRKDTDSSSSSALQRQGVEVVCERGVVVAIVVVGN